MLESSIRALASGTSSPLVTSALFEKTVQIWDLGNLERISQFETVYGCGGPKGRLTMAPNGDRCLAANWRSGKQGGVACYDTRTGKVIWHRTDLKQTQDVNYSTGGQSVWWCPESGPSLRLDANNGESKESLRGSPRVFESEHSGELLLEYKKRERPYILRTRNIKHKFPDVALGSWTSLLRRTRYA